MKNEKEFVINEESSSEKSSSLKQSRKKIKGKTNKIDSKKLERKKSKRTLISKEGKRVDFEDNKIDNDKIMKIKNNQELFFSLIKLLSNITYFFLKKNDVFNTFLKINDLSFYQLLLKENYITLE